MLSGAPVTRNALIGFGAAAFVGCQFAFKFQSVIGRILGSFLVSKPNEALETAVLIYQVQNIERIIGSNKLFARSFYTGLTACVLCGMPGVEVSVPTVLVFSMLAPFVKFVTPRRRAHFFWKFSLSDKSLPYCVFAALAQFNPTSALIGCLMGLLTLNWDAKLGNFGPESDDVSDPVGATLEIQRKIKAEREEQRMIQQQMAQFNQPMRNGPIRRPPPPRPQPQYVPNAAEIASLTQMGFSEERVRAALIECRGDIARAAEKLVQA